MERQSIQYGMSIRGPTGERLGRVVACGDDLFLVRTPFRTHPHAAIRYADVASLANGLLHLRRGPESLIPLRHIHEQGPWLTVRPIDPTAATVAAGITH